MDISVLTTIKKMLGIDAAVTDFDTDLIVLINSVFVTLKQLGVGPSTTFQITGSTEVWSNFATDIDILSFAKTYVYLKVKSTFDPPTSSAVLEAMKSTISELEWRLNAEIEEGTYVPPEIPDEE